MLDHEDLKWIASTSTELNSILQQVSRYSDLARRHKGEHNYIDLMGERVELASKTAQSLFDKVTTKILANATKVAKAPPAPSSPFKVLPPPIRHSATNSTSAALSFNPPEIVKTKTAKNSAPAKAAATASTIPAEISVKNAKGN